MSQYGKVLDGASRAGAGDAELDRHISSTVVSGYPSGGAAPRVPATPTELSVPGSRFRGRAHSGVVAGLTARYAW
ncbi:hypothetical protein ACFQZZ_06415 [Nocardia sp. GCM10030253]|uniref:hypothetical protein n=1 Tax=Nocardia sp. GCM10030253 TaxID=3273404 RepID=UPI0036334B06